MNGAKVMILVFRLKILFSYFFKERMQKILMMNTFQFVKKYGLFQKFSYFYKHIRTVEKDLYGCWVNPYGRSRISKWVKSREKIPFSSFSTDPV